LIYLKHKKLNSNPVLKVRLQMKQPTSSKEVTMMVEEKKRGLGGEQTGEEDLMKELMEDKRGILGELINMRKTKDLSVDIRMMKVTKRVTNKRIRARKKTRKKMTRKLLNNTLITSTHLKRV
jgi:hypothetical protein